jgi:hypothetical protein
VAREAPRDDRSAWNREQSFHLFPNSDRVGARGFARPRLLAICLTALVDDAALRFCFASLKVSGVGGWMKHSIRKDAFIDCRNVDGIVYRPPGKPAVCGVRTDRIPWSTAPKFASSKAAWAVARCVEVRRCSLRTLSRWRLRTGYPWLGFARGQVQIAVTKAASGTSEPYRARIGLKPRPISFVDVSGRPMTLFRRRAVLWPAFSSPRPSRTLGQRLAAGVGPPRSRRTQTPSLCGSIWG